MTDIVTTVKATIDARDRGVSVLRREYREYKRELIPRVQEAVRSIVKDPEIKVYAQQKWRVDTKLTQYLRNLPLHPMPFHNQSVRISARKGGGFFIDFKNRQLDKGEYIRCYLLVPSKYRDLISLACGDDWANPHLGEVELIEDLRYGRFNVHIPVKTPKPDPYEPEGWIGIDVGWNCLAVSAHVTSTKIGNVTFHGKELKTRIIQLKYLLKQYQRSGRSWKKWNFRLNHVTKNASGRIAKEIVEKAEKNRAGIAMEDLSFRSHTKRWLIPRYKLKAAIQNLCERKGIPFTMVDPRNTSITCNRCGHQDRESRNGKTFKCVSCGYQVNSDMNAAVNIGRAVILTGYTSAGKTSRPCAEEGGEIATPTNPSTPPQGVADARRANRMSREDP